MTVKTLETAIGKATALSDAAQEQIGHELLMRIASIEGLRSEVQVGAAQLDAGLGGELDIEEVIAEARREHAKR